MKSIKNFTSQLLGAGVTSVATLAIIGAFLLSVELFADNKPAGAGAPIARIAETGRISASAPTGWVTLHRQVVAGAEFQDEHVLYAGKEVAGGVLLQSTFTRGYRGTVISRSNTFVPGTTAEELKSSLR